MVESSLLSRAGRRAGLLSLVAAAAGDDAQSAQASEATAEAAAPADAPAAAEPGSGD
jgi:hypothetical protein